MLKNAGDLFDIILIRVLPEHLSRWPGISNSRLFQELGWVKGIAMTFSKKD